MKGDCSPFFLSIFYNQATVSQTDQQPRTKVDQLHYKTLIDTDTQLKKSSLGVRWISKVYRNRKTQQAGIERAVQKGAYVIISFVVCFCCFKVAWWSVSEALILIQRNIYISKKVYSKVMKSAWKKKKNKP